MADAALPTNPIEVLPSAARTAAVVSAAFDGLPDTFKGLLVLIEVTALTADASITPTVQVWDGNSWETGLAGAAITATGPVALILYPDLTDVANKVEGTAVTNAYRFSMAVADAKSVTYSVKAFTLV